MDENKIFASDQTKLMISIVTDLHVKTKAKLDLIVEDISSLKSDKEEIKIFIQDTISKMISDEFIEIHKKLDRIINATHEDDGNYY